MSFNSKYSGQQVEDLLDKVANGNTGGGGGGSSSGSSAYPLVNHGSEISVRAIQPNIFHLFGDVEDVDLILEDGDESVVNEYVFQFTYLEGPFPCSFPDTIKWANGEPVLEDGKTYQISIVNNIGLIVSV